MTKSKSKLPPAKNWRERNIEDWNAHTFQAYMAERHQELFGIDYTTNNYGMENSHLKAFFTKYDCATLKRFIDACFADYTPRPGWPGVNFAFMSSKMKDRIFPRLQLQMKAERLLGGDIPKENTEDSESLKNIEW